MITDQEVEDYNALAVSLFKKYESYICNNEKRCDDVNFPVLAAISNLGLMVKGKNKRRMIDIASKLNTSNTFAMTTVISDSELGDLNKDIKPYVYHVRINQNDDENEKQKIIRTANEWVRLKSGGLVRELLTNSDIERFGKNCMNNKSENITRLMSIKTLINCHWYQPQEESTACLSNYGRDECILTPCDYRGDGYVFIANIPYTWKPGSMIIYQPHYLHTGRDDFIKILTKLEVPGEFDKFLKSFDKNNTLSVEMPKFFIHCDSFEFSRFINEERKSYSDCEIFEKDFDIKYLQNYRPKPKDPIILGRGIGRGHLHIRDKPFLYFALDGSNCIIDAGIQRGY